MKNVPRFSGILLLAALAACGRDSPPASPSSPVTIVGLFIVGLPPVSMVVGQTIALRTVLRYSDGLSIDATAQTTWLSDAPMVAPVSTTGTVNALTAGTATISAAYPGATASAKLRVAQTWPEDLDFRVVILNATSTPKPEADVLRIFAVANDILQRRTGARMRLVDMREAGLGSPRGRAEEYLASRSSDLPDGILVWAEDDTAVAFGGYSTQIAQPPPYANRYPGAGGDNRVYLAAIHWDHKYGRCGYDTTGQIRIGDRSANGECRDQSGLLCVNNGRFWECPDVAQDLYAQPDIFPASSIVHEFLHPFGSGGNNDHYSTAACRARLGMSAAASADRRLSQEHCAMCPDLFLNFRPR